MNTLNNIVKEITESSEAQETLRCVKDIFGYDRDNDGDFLEFCQKWVKDTPSTNNQKLKQTLHSLISDVRTVEDELYSASDEVETAFNSLESVYISEDCASNVRHKMESLITDLEGKTKEKENEDESK